MFRPLAFLLIVMITRVVVTEPILRRQTSDCGCPQFDVGGFPLATSSGPVSTGLHCIYLDTDRCIYNTTSGSLLLDESYGDCPPSAPGGICPPFDTVGFCLGPGSTVFDSAYWNAPVLVCTYPTGDELVDTRFYCDYTTTGALTLDNDDSYCYASADCPRPTAPAPTQSATCGSVTPTATPMRTSTTARPYTTL